MRLALRLFTCAATAALAAPALAQDSFGQPAQGQQQQYPQQQYPEPQYPEPQQYPQPPQQQYPQPPQQQYPKNPQDQYPQQPTYPAQQPAYPGPQPASPGGDLDQLMQMERQDYGVTPTSQLHSGAMHGPTPASIPGGQVITTKGLIELVKGQQGGALLFDVLGGPETIPGALSAVPASQAGSFSDQTQQEFGGFLKQMTQGNQQTPLVFYCQSTQCWMSYNAALRAINMGYTNVLWYRGGIEAWKMGGQQSQSQQQQPQHQQPQQQPQQGYPR
jgi:PQQ-dependent catabolism-associated CXXCW motif protein